MKVVGYVLYIISHRMVGVKLIRERPPSPDSGRTTMSTHHRSLYGLGVGFPGLPRMERHPCSARRMHPRGMMAKVSVPRPVYRQRMTMAGQPTSGRPIPTMGRWKATPPPSSTWTSDSGLRNQGQ